MKKSFLIICSLVLVSGLTFADVIDDINSALKTGNYRELVKLFNTTIELNIPGKEGVYSKAQAEQILKEFFYKNQPKSFTLIHQGESKEGARYSMGNLTTSGGNYRTYCHLKKNGDTYFIKELRIETNK